MTRLIYDGGESREGFDFVNLTLDATDDARLDFLSSREAIERAIEEGKRLFFEFQFGLDPITHNFKDQMKFFGLSIGVATFIEKIYEPYKDHIEGVFLYRGAGDFHRAVLSHFELADLFEEFKEGIRADESHLKYLFSLQLLMEYLHKLAAALPDELALFALLNLKGVSSSAKQAELLSMATFPYIKPAVKGAQVMFEGLTWEKGTSWLGYVGSDLSQWTPMADPTVAIVLPELGYVNYDEIDREIAALHKAGISYKVIPEGMLNESWHLIDDLIVFEGAVSSEGKRMIDGFIAAGGTVKKSGDLCKVALSE